MTNAICTAVEIPRKSDFLSVHTAPTYSYSSESCGGPNRLSVHTSKGSKSMTPTALAAPTVQTTNLPGKWEYSRCLAWVLASLSTSNFARQLLIPIHSERGAAQVFPYQIKFPQNNTGQNCLSQCSTFGYPAAGMKASDECCM